MIRRSLAEAHRVFAQLARELVPPGQGLLENALQEGSEFLWLHRSH